jgi:hypothetical protein
MRKTHLYDEVVSSETAILAKTAGFDADCKVCPLYYCEFEGQVIISPNPCPKSCRIICMAPTQPLLQRWLREEKAVHIQVILWDKGFFSQVAVYEYYEEEKEYGVRASFQSRDFDTYELALEDALKYALENLVSL